MLRLALSGYDGLWKDILDTNQEAVRNALDFYISELKSIRARIGGDLSEEFKRGGEFASTLRNPVE
jgi:prephenate dehydrogenase